MYIPLHLPELHFQYVDCDRGLGLDSQPEEVDMPRTDENGKQLKAVLNYFLDGDVQSSDLCEALEIATSTYYRRIKDADYPDAEELRKVAQKFDLSFLDLVVRFGLMSDEDMTREVQKYCALRQLEQVGPFGPGGNAGGNGAKDIAGNDTGAAAAGGG
jgi:hypothetical protein